MNAAPAPQPRGGRRLAGALLLAVAAVPLAGLALAACAPAGWHPTTLARHLAVHLAIAALPFVLWQGRRPWAGAVYLCLAIPALWPWLAAAWAPRAPAPAAGAATAVVANLYYANADHRPALAALDGDVVALIETLPGDRQALRGDRRWPHQHWLVTPDRVGGFALLSRWPMAAEELDLLDAPAIRARVQAPWGPLTVIAAHPWSPGRPYAARMNRRQLAELAGHGATTPGPLLLLGDLNATPADPGFAGLRAAGLLPPHGGGPRTWPSFLGWAGIAIDHALAKGLALGAAEPVWLPGSDHRGVRVRFGP